MEFNNEEKKILSENQELISRGTLTTSKRLPNVIFLVKY